MRGADTVEAATVLVVWVVTPMRGRAMNHSEEKIRAALLAMHMKATGETKTPYMSIPADPERDADLILEDAIDELMIRDAPRCLRK